MLWSLTHVWSWTSVIVACVASLPLKQWPWRTERQKSRYKRLHSPTLENQEHAVLQRHVLQTHFLLIRGQNSLKITVNFKLKLILCGRSIFGYSIINFQNSMSVFFCEFYLWNHILSSLSANISYQLFLEKQAFTYVKMNEYIVDLTSRDSYIIISNTVTWKHRTSHDRAVHNHYSMWERK